MTQSNDTMNENNSENLSIRCKNAEAINDTKLNESKKLNRKIGYSKSIDKLSLPSPRLNKRYRFSVLPTVIK